MINRIGGATIGAALAIAGFVGIGTAALGVMTGTTPCQLIHGCAVACPDSKSPSADDSKTIELINNETKSGSCCDLAKTLQASAEKAGCCASQAKAQTIAASAKSGCCANKAATSCKKALIAREASMPIVMPAAFYIPASYSSDELASSCCKSTCTQTIAAAANTATCAKACPMSAQTLAAAAPATGCCKDKAAAETIAASATKSGCCKDAAAAQTVNAAATTGCCKDKAAATTVAASTDSGCCAAKAAQAIAASAKSGCCSSKAATSCKKAVIAREASMPIVMPAAFYIPATYTTNDLTDAGCCKSKAINASATNECAGEKPCCKKAAEPAAI